MYSYVNIWRMNDVGALGGDAVAREVAARLRAQPGFRSYTLIRNDVWEVTAITVFDSQEQLEAAMDAVAEVVRTRVDPLAAGPPERRHGEVLYRVTAGAVLEAIRHGRLSRGRVGPG